MDTRLEFRASVLAAGGATLEQQRELLAYCESRFQAPAFARFPCPDEPFVEAWLGYAKECECAGSIIPLYRHLAQLNFPVEVGMSTNPIYRAATRGGYEPSEAARIGLEHPERCRVTIHVTPAGRIPVVFCGERQDFVLLVQALTKKNEPAPIPASMGASMVAGYNNLSRLRELRRQFESSGNPGGEADWQAELKRIIPQRELYQDKFILLSDGPYSGVPATAMRMDEDEWRAASRVIRREHECTHYFTRRVLGSMRNNLLDELIADCMGIVAAHGRFRAEWLLRFMGLEGEAPRLGGRFQNYLADPPISNGAADHLARLVKRACINLETLPELNSALISDPTRKAAVIIKLAGVTLEELAAAPRVDFAPELLH